MKQFIKDNIVLISGLVSAITLVLTDALTSPEMHLGTIGFGALVAVLSVLANQWKGKGLTVTGLVGSVAGAIVTIVSQNTFTWRELLLASLVAVLTTFSSGLSAYANNQSK